MPWSNHGSHRRGGAPDGDRLLGATYFQGSVTFKLKASEQASFGDAKAGLPAAPSEVKEQYKGLARWSGDLVCAAPRLAGIIATTMTKYDLGGEGQPSTRLLNTAPSSLHGGWGQAYRRYGLWVAGPSEA